MNSETAQSVVEKASDNINLTTVLIVVFAVGWLLERIVKISKSQKTVTANGSPTWKTFRSELDKKVNGSDCSEFKMRIGNESSDHRRNIEHMKEDLSDIKSNVAYIKGKME